MMDEHLSITTAQVRRISFADDDMGGAGTTTTVLTTLSKCAIYPVGIGSPQLRYISDSLNLLSGFVLLTLPSYYTWNKDDKEVVYNNVTYKVNGYDNDVMSLGEMAAVSMELVK